LSEIRVTKDAPYLVSGELPLAKATIGTNAEGESMRWEWGKPLPAQKNAALCRCGASKNKPFCDGSHAAIKFLRMGFRTRLCPFRRSYGASTR
jgi:CDGSH-type Zn-finger protein